MHNVYNLRLISPLNIDHTYSLNCDFWIFFPECAKELDIVMVLDGSNSIYPWSSIIDFLRRFIENIEIGPKLSQVSYIYYWTDLYHVDFCGKLNIWVYAVESDMGEWVTCMG